MKFKRIVTCLLALCALLSCCSFSGCIITHEIVEQIETVPWFDYDEERTLSDYIPEEYGEWDGNYIYSGNMRSKTTGEALEKLVEEITIGEETYAVSVWSPYYIDDNMFAMASFTVEEKTHNCLIKYNIKDKTTEILYYSLEKPLKGFYYMRSDRIILKVIEDETVKLITLDMQGNVVEEDSSYYLEYKPYSDYLMREEGNTLYLRKWDDELEYCLGTYNPRYEIKIRTIDGTKGIQIKHYQKKNSQGLYVVGWEEVYYFDLETCTLSKLLGFEEERYYNDQRLNAAYIEKVIDYDENYCFIYNRKVTDKEVEFYYLSLLNMSYAAIPDDCVLYKLVRAVNGKVSLKEEYDFSEYNDYLADFTKHGVRMVYKNNFYFRGYIYEDSVVYYQERPRWFVLETVNGKKSVRIIKEAEYYTLDCFSEENILKAELSKGQECDGYIYYKIDDYLGSYESLHNFRRYNIATGKVDIMQCWNSSWDEEYDYAAEELWEQKLDWCVRSY